MDRFEPPWLGRRRGWLVLTQLALAGALVWMAATPPASALGAFALLACLVAMLSASQDIVVDAYRTDLLPAAERGMGSSLTVLGYRMAMILSGGIAFIWVDPRQGGGWSWPEVYRAMALFMVFAAAFSALLVPRLVDAARPVERRAQRPARLSRRRRRGRARLRRHPLRLLAAGARAGAAAASRAAASRRPCSSAGPTWSRLFAGIAFTLPLVAWAARRARFETLLGGLKSYFAQPGAAPFLAFIVLYKLPRRLRRRAAHAVPADGDAVQHRRGRRRQQGDRPVADDHRRAHRRRADDPPRPVARAAAVRHPADARQPRLLVARGARPRRAARPDDPAVRLGLRQARRGDAGRRRPADGDRQREHHQRHGHRRLPGVPDEPVQPALQRHPVRPAERVRLGRPGLGRAARRRAGAVDRLAGVLHRLDHRRPAGLGLAVGVAASRSICWRPIRLARTTTAMAETSLFPPRRALLRLHVRRGSAGARSSPCSAARCSPPAVPDAGAREGVEVGAALAAEQARQRRAGRAGRGAAVQRRCSARRRRSARSRRPSHPQVERLRYIAAAPDPAHLRMESARPAMEVGGQPDRQQADQRLLHAGRQDRLLLRHPRPAQARPTTRSR